MLKFLWPFMLFAPAIVTSQLLSRALRSGSYQRRRSNNELVFSRPDAVPVFRITLSLTIAFMIAVIINPEIIVVIVDPETVLGTTSPWQYAKTHLDLLGELFGGGFLTAFLYWAVLHWWHKTCVLILDPDQHRYRALDMSTFFPSVRSGTWEEISGIAIRRSSTKGGLSFFVVLRWKQASRLYSTLGGFTRSDQAEAYAQRLSNEVRLPVMGPLS